VGHVDDAHEAEGDGETEGDDEEDAAEAEAAEEGAEKVDGGEVAVDGVECGAGGGGERGVAGGFRLLEGGPEGVGAADGVEGFEFLERGEFDLGAGVFEADEGDGFAEGELGGGTVSSFWRAWRAASFSAS
jgi:hypothetical protein